ncbi:MAG: hypothetical protein JRI61_04945 [Deltaproteobacteria bacterium]|nr:hypothetical protein [Deltaproteobacteria bacterium]
MKRNLINLILIVLTLLIFSCALKQVSKSTPRYNTLETDLYYLSITPLSTYDRHCGFRLIVKNKTPNKLLVDWNNAFYTEDGVRKGGFMHDGMDFESRYDPMAQATVRGWDIYIKTIWPSVLAHGKRDQWTQMPMEPGRHGVEITLAVNGQVFHETLDVEISVESR